MLSLAWPKLVTIWLIIASVAVWILWDPIAFLIGGPQGEATESVTLGTWMDKSLWVTFAIFMLALHLAASGTGRFGWKHAVAAIVGGVVGYLLTRFS